MNKISVLAIILVLLIAGCFVGRTNAYLRAGRDKIPIKDEAQRSSKLKTIFDKMRSAQVYKDSPYRFLNSWNNEQGMVER